MSYVSVNDNDGCLKEYRDSHPIGKEILAVMRHIFGAIPYQVYVQLPNSFYGIESRFIKATNDARVHFGLDLFTRFETPKGIFSDPGLDEELR